VLDGVIRQLSGATVRYELRALEGLTAADQSLAAGALGEKPLVVLTRSAGRLPPEFWRRWHALHAELAQLSGNARHVVADQAGHYIHRDDPGLVVAAIREVLRSVRTGSPLAADLTARR
jgi:pimeloyl-ACP methyl ester carboxylesterase